jgi:hypothetical protein
MNTAAPQVGRAAIVDCAPRSKTPVAFRQLDPEPQTGRTSAANRNARLESRRLDDHHGAAGRVFRPTGREGRYCLPGLAHARLRPACVRDKSNYKKYVAAQQLLHLIQRKLYSNFVATKLGRQ